MAKVLTKDQILLICTRRVVLVELDIIYTLYINAKWLETSEAFQGGLAVAISIKQHPNDQMSHERP